jgi:hypothetical protein
MEDVVRAGDAAVAQFSFAMGMPVYRVAASFSSIATINLLHA